MTDLQELGQEGFLLGLSNSDNSGGSCEGEKQAPLEIKWSEKAARSEKRGGNGKGSGGSSGSGGGKSSDHEIHIWTERERRKKMRNMFANLHVLLPQLPSKADKSTIVDEAVNYIKTLQQTLQKLQKQKLERLQSASITTLPYDPASSLITKSHQKQLPTSDYTRESFLADQVSTSNTNNNPNPSVFYGTPVAFQTWTSSNVVLNICGNEAQFSVCSPKEKLGFFSTVCYVLEKHKVEVVSAHVSSDCNRSMYMIQARASSALDHQMTDAFAIDEIYKQAAGEIMLWMST